MTLRTVTRLWLVACTGAAAWWLQAMAGGTATPATHVSGIVATLVAATAVGVAALRWCNPPTTAMMQLTTRRLRRSGHPGTLVREWAPLERISREMWLTAIAAEDAYFRDHSGFDWDSVREARAHNQTHANKRGGSTITQQVAKNLFLWPARSYVRKGIEAVLTAIIEAVWPKRRILEVYLNVAQFGPDLFGVQAAARRFFGKDASGLTLQESALLTAALPNPVRYQLEAPTHRLRFRQSWILLAARRLGDLYLERL